MKIFFIFFFWQMIAFFCTLVINAGSFVQQQIKIQVDPINELRIQGGDAIIKIDYTGGYSPLNFLTIESSYDVTTNEINKKIVGQLDDDMPERTRLLVSLTAPTGATSSGFVSLTTQPTDLVTDISRINEMGNHISYLLFLSRTLSPNFTFSRKVTLTFVDGS